MCLYTVYMNSSSYEQPREKLANKGAAALSTVELVQVIIGSGNARSSVYKIAKKVAKVLAKSGTEVHPKELLSIPGVGMVKAGQILALFELAARFPKRSINETYTTPASLESFHSELVDASKQNVLYVTFDGANRLIVKRQLAVDYNISITRQVQKIFADCISDAAVSLFIAIGWSKQTLEPELVELNFIRDIYKTSQLLSIQVRQITLVASSGSQVLKGFK